MLSLLMCQSTQERFEHFHALEGGDIIALLRATVFAFFILEGLVDDSNLTFAEAAVQLPQGAVSLPRVAQRGIDPIDTDLEASGLALHRRGFPA